MNEPQVAERERIGVALSGAPSTERLVQRGARLAAECGAEIIGIVVADRTFDEASRTRLDEQRRLIEQLGGSFVEVHGERVVDALIDAAIRYGVTQLVVGASPHSNVRRRMTSELLARAADIDVHLIGNDDITRRPGRLGLPGRRRQMVGFLLAVLLLPSVTALLEVTHDRQALSTVLLSYVLVVVMVSSVGGFIVGLAGAAAASVCATYFFADPVHHFAVTDTENSLALIAFLFVSVIVSLLVHVERRRAREAHEATRVAEAVAQAALVLARSEQPVSALVDQLWVVVDRRPVALESFDGERWTPVETRGVFDASSTSLENPASVLAVDHLHRLRIGGDRLPTPARRLAGAIGSQLATAVSSEALRRDKDRAQLEASGDAYRTTLLRAVSHDLRTPLTAIKTSVSSLRSTSIDWPEAERAEFLEVIETSADRLERMVANLLDLSRLQTGAISARITPVDPAEVIAAALGTVGLVLGRCVVRADHRLVDADAALLERVIANLVSNADRVAPAGTAIEIDVVEITGERVEIRIVDHGHGIPPDRRADLLQPFRRLDDRHPGSGLGLAIVDGFMQAMGGTFELGDTPGGGVTATIGLPLPAFTAAIERSTQ